jgi:hypothetical protein
LTDRKRNVEVAAQIYEGKPLDQILPESIESYQEVKIDQQWWLQKFFRAHKLSFVQGVLLIYLVKVVPTIVQIFLLGNLLDVNTLTAIYSTFLGDLFIPVSLLLINAIYKSWVNLTKTTNQSIRENQFVAPPVLIKEKHLKSSECLEFLDKDYSNRYIKPIVTKTLQSGLNLTFDKHYQLGSGMISTSLLFGLILFVSVTKILPNSMLDFKPTDYGSTLLNFTNSGAGLFAWAMDWFIIGFLTWTLFTSFLCIIQVSGNPLKVRPYEQVKKRFAPVFSLVVRTTLTVAFIVAWVSPFSLVWSILPSDPISRQQSIYYLESILIVTIPIIVLSFVLPLTKTHKALSETCDRLLLLKSHQLEEIKKLRESEPDKYLKIERHLILDYKDIQKNPTWFLDLQQALQLIGSVLLPIVTFWLSTLLQ